MNDATEPRCAVDRRRPESKSSTWSTWSLDREGRAVVELLAIRNDLPFESLDPVIDAIFEVLDGIWPASDPGAPDFIDVDLLTSVDPLGYFLGVRSAADFWTAAAVETAAVRALFDGLKSAVGTAA